MFMFYMLGMCQHLKHKGEGHLLCCETVDTRCWNTRLGVSVIRRPKLSISIQSLTLKPQLTGCDKHKSEQTHTHTHIHTHTYDPKMHLTWKWLNQRVLNFKRSISDWGLFFAGTCYLLPFWGCFYRGSVERWMRWRMHAVQQSPGQRTGNESASLTRAHRCTPEGWTCGLNPKGAQLIKLHFKTSWYCQKNNITYTGQKSSLWQWLLHTRTCCLSLNA